MKKTLLIFVLLTFSFLAQAAKSVFILPADYDSQGLFIRVRSTFNQDISEKTHFFEQCKGDLKTPICSPITTDFSSRVSSSRLNFIRFAEATKGTIIGSAEVIVGGVFFRALTRFILPSAYKIVQRTTGWDESVAIGTVALVPSVITTTGATVFVLNKLNETVEVIDPLERFSSSSLMNKIMNEKIEVIMVNHQFKKLKKRILSLINPPKQL